MRSHRLRRRYGHTGGAAPVHFLVDWNTIACRKRMRRTDQSSRSPHDVTCERCMKKKPFQFDPVDRAYARAVAAGVKKSRDNLVEWINAAGGPEAVLRMSPVKIREGVGGYLGG